MMECAEQLMIPLKSVNRHHYSPTFIRFWDAWFDFDYEMGTYFPCECGEDGDESPMCYCDWEDDKITIGVPVRIEDQSAVSCEELELWTARLNEAIRLLKCGKYDMFYTIRNEII